MPAAGCNSNAAQCHRYRYSRGDSIYRRSGFNPLGSVMTLTSPRSSRRVTRTLRAVVVAVAVIAVVAKETRRIPGQRRDLIIASHARICCKSLAA